MKSAIGVESATEPRREASQLSTILADGSNRANGDDVSAPGRMLVARRAPNSAALIGALDDFT